MPRPQKRSVTLQGHRTSVTLEAEFWDTLKDIAVSRSLSINELIVEVDNTRLSGSKVADIGLSSALRVYVLNFIKTK